MIEAGAGAGQAARLATLRKLALDLGMPRDACLLLVDAGSQVLCGGTDTVDFSYPVSISALGLGEKSGSFKTPRGLHEVTERYGDGVLPGGIFRSRAFTGEVLPAEMWRHGEEDLILSRILRLAGREPGLNEGGDVDTYSRMIYVHGTNQEESVGVRAASHGCIRMRNLDVIELFNRLKDMEAWVWVG